jgi:RNA polymerase-binding transcription factor DksA
MINKIQDEIKDLENQAKDCKEELKKLENATSNAMYLLDRYSNFEEVYDLATNEEKKAILQDVINRIVISKSEINIQLNVY